jgi:glycosyltransferase involved in cell wall biosynthesis
MESSSEQIRPARMSETPLVSIVTPTLNQGRFIEQTIRSIEGQTYRHFEHIVVDGGSTDETLEILRRHGGSYPMRWTSEPDRGMYDAINKGMRQARGQILAYLNSDDLYFPWTLEVIVDAFERHPEADVVFGDALGIQEETGNEDVRFQPSFRYDFLLRSGSFVQPSVFWRSSVWEDVGEFNQAFRLAGDLDFWLRIGPDRRYRKVDELLSIERDHLDTKRSSQWSALMQESAACRAPFDLAAPFRRRAGLIAGRFRAWWARRVYWARFARESGRRRASPGRPWARYLAASDVRLSRGRLLAAQVPWLGRRIASGSLSSGVDWLRGGGAKGDLGSPDLGR